MSAAQELQNNRVILEPASEANVDLLVRWTLDPVAQGPYKRVPEMSAAQLRELNEGFAMLNHRSQKLYAALNEVGKRCRKLNLPSLPALVVRADTRQPGAA